MNERDRVRGVGLLCCHCVRNIAYYQGGRRGGVPASNRDFWRNTSGNCLDIAVLEWCKLFADKRGKHHWSKVVGETDPFLLALLGYLDITAEEFDCYINSVKHYRDNFVAHLDEKRQISIPELTPAKSSAIYLFDRVRAENPEALADAPTGLNEFYEKRKAHAKREYRIAT